MPILSRRLSVTHNLDYLLTSFKVIHSVKELAAKRKLFHKDLKQEHIVWDTPAKKIRFIDMAQVDQIDNTQISRATNSMLDALKLLEGMNSFVLS